MSVKHLLLLSSSELRAYLAEVLHDGRIVRVPTRQVSLFAEQNVSFGHVLVVRVDASTNSRVPSDPVASVDVKDVAH
jgi:hypothetical protein